VKTKILYRVTSSRTYNDTRRSETCNKSHLKSEMRICMSYRRNLLAERIITEIHASAHTVCTHPNKLFHHPPPHVLLQRCYRSRRGLLSRPALVRCCQRVASRPARLGIFIHVVKPGQLKRVPVSPKRINPNLCTNIDTWITPVYVRRPRTL
jgi:hypothetical protein